MFLTEIVGVLRGYSTVVNPAISDRTSARTLLQLGKEPLVHGQQEAKLQKVFQVCP